MFRLTGGLNDIGHKQMAPKIMLLARLKYILVSLDTSLIQGLKFK